MKLSFGRWKKNGGTVENYVVGGMSSSRKQRFASHCGGSCGSGSPSSYQEREIKSFNLPCINVGNVGGIFSF